MSSFVLFSLILLILDKLEMFMMKDKRVYLLN